MFFKKEFKVASFSFERDPEEDIFVFLERQAFYGSDVAKNLHRFFMETDLTRFDISKRQSFSAHPNARTIRSGCTNIEEGGWSCHIAAPFLATQGAGWERFYFGFASQNLRTGTEVHTMLHSFNADEEGNFVDPHYESVCDHESWWWKTYGQSQGLQKPRVSLEDFHSYVGVSIPLNVARSILYISSSTKGNFWGYANRKIFHDHWKTNWFIDVVNSGGERWKYEGRVKYSTFDYL